MTVPSVSCVKTLEGKGEDEGDKSLTIFDTPRDVRGTAMLYLQLQEQGR